ncbi:Peptidase C39-like domain-containing protein [Mycobacterium sp. smrl_JER01]
MAAPNFTCRGHDGTRSARQFDAAGDKAEGMPEEAGTEIVGGVFGDPEAATRFWEQQSEGDCGLMATRMVVGEITGDPPTEREIIDLAADTPSQCSPGEPVYDESIDPADGGVGHGTCSTDLLLLLKHFGIDADYTNDDEAAAGGLDTGIDALADYLGNGQQAMVCVNSRIIWDTDGDRTNCGHMITVAAIDFDNDIVYLGDSGGDDTRGEQVSIDTFESAWATGEHELIVTR